MGGGGGEIVKSSIVGDHSINIVLTHYIFDNVLDCFPSAEYPLALFNVLPILRHFVNEVGTFHYAFVKENVCDYKRALLIDFALFVNDRKAKVITYRAFNVICGFGIEH